MKALAIGAILWDIFSDGEHIGGASFNPCAHLARLGWHTALLTSVGCDARGDRALDIMDSLGVDTRFVQRHPTLPTGTAEVVLDADGAAAYRLPYSAYDEIEWNEELLQAVCDFAPDVLCIGTHEQRSQRTVEIFREVCGYVPLEYVYYDANFRQDFFPLDILCETWRRANLLKLNDLEAETVSGLLGLDGASPAELARHLIAEYDLRAVVVTLGGAGCLLCYDKECVILPPPPAKIVSTVGCGDAFNAGFLTTLMQGGNYVQAAKNGNILGAYVGCFEEALPAYTDEIIQHFRKE